MRGDAREQLSRPKGLVDVVVGPDLEPQDDIDLLVLGTQDDDGHPMPRVPDLTAHVEAREIREHQVQQDDVGMETIDSV